MAPPSMATDLGMKALSVSYLFGGLSPSSSTLLYDDDITHNNKLHVVRNIAEGPETAENKKTKQKGTPHPGFSNSAGFNRNRRYGTLTKTFLRRVIANEK